MEAFIGRQPILTVDKELYGYELLHRSSKLNSYQGFDGTQATATVISNSYLSFGLDQLSDQKRCFINFTEELLVDEVPTFFSPESIIVEILESVKLTDNVIAACHKLKRLGYKLALDDVTDMSNYEKIIDLIDIIKVDFMETSRQKRLEIVEQFSHLPITFLAEKVETLEEFEEAKELGYVLFQGYFFSKPIILSTKDIKPMPQQYVKMLEEINQPVPDISLVSELVERDLALSYKLLRLINSLGLPVKVSNIRQAIVLLGLFEVKKWIMILMLTKETNESSKVIQLSLIRSRLSERIARKIRINPSDASFIGMFSLLECILQRPMSNILLDLPIEDHIKAALMDENHTSIYAHVLKLVKAIEQCDWETVDLMLVKVKVSMDDLQEDYFEAVHWANSVIDTFRP
ncbi:EAL domain-containing protein [Bacillus sp. NTK071]|uniref:EAL and HDOD domain-containing protein n=1 Tax=Bacillus sp. NTK071 TaxID=2802175 RepID=UPI001A8D0B10|nr:EAL domain-containing protein [Bacillus sp. NTK071]MBN8208668.1 EAL domain-containing protein [Bacillus sp. NTK071]